MPTPLRVTDPADTAGHALRTPPHNYEAERALLGAILMNNRAFERIQEFLRPEHFADPVNGRIYESCAKLIEQGHQANPVTLKTYLERDDLVIAAGGMKYLASLAAGAVTIINATEYGRLVYDLFLRRELIELGENIVNKAFDATPDESAMSQIEDSEQVLFNLASEGTLEGGFQNFGNVLVTAINLAEAAHRREGALAGVTSGLTDLDKKLGGLHASDLIILAGRPSMGKTSLATTIAFNAANYYRTTDRADDRGKQVAFFSLEMSAEQLATRILAERSKINSHMIRTGGLSNDDFSRLVVASQEVNELPLFIDDTPAVTVSTIRTRCRRLARQNKSADGGSGLGLIVIDYLQLIAPSRGERAENRVQEISAMTRGLKALAKELNVPVIALSQLSRAVEQREDKRPQLSDLRESGTIEQDSDVVMFVYREQYYLERGEPSQRPEESSEKFHERMLKWQERCEQAHNVAEVIVAKQRHGPIGTVRVYFDPNFTHFSDLVDQSHLPPPIED
jgi:replicative DNA helicase